ncbi:hypothetical protein HA466_0241880 [Hirschfeldia incana]|nr:hypothetical protein HA466_0241880 [Hirschfeldia incana]
MSCRRFQQLRRHNPPLRPPLCLFLQLSPRPQPHSFHHRPLLHTLSSLSLPRNLISAAADGSVAIFYTDPFVLLKSFRPHKKAVNRSRDSPLREARAGCYRDECFAMLNLVRGKTSFCCRLGHEASLVKFDPSRERFFMVVNSKVGVHQSEDSKLLLELDNGSRKHILCASPGDSGTLFTAGEDRAITASDTNSGKLAYSEV